MILNLNNFFSTESIFMNLIFTKLAEHRSLFTMRVALCTEMFVCALLLRCARILISFGFFLTSFQTNT